jgi:hypothetical protein
LVFKDAQDSGREEREQEHEWKLHRDFFFIQSDRHTGFVEEVSWMSSAHYLVLDYHSPTGKKTGQYLFQLLVSILQASAIASGGWRPMHLISRHFDAVS